MSFLDCLEETVRQIAPARVVSENNRWTDSCHNLAQARNGKVAMFSALKTPWHGLGKVIDRAATSAEALRLAELAGWDLQKIQAYIDFNAQKIATDVYGIVRGDTGDLLGTVGERYTIVPNEQCFAIMDDIVQQGGARYETAGALGKGEMVWMLANMPSRVEPVKGDECLPYLLCTTSHDGSASIRIFPTTVRVVCQNTFRAATSAGRGKGICLRHTTNVGQRVKDAQIALGFAKKQLDTFSERAHLLAHTRLEPQEYFRAVLDDILDVTVADQKVTQAAIKGGSVLDAILDLHTNEAKATAQAQYERALARRGELLMDMVARYDNERNGGNPAIAGTAWAAFNAVSEHVDHSPLWRANKQAEGRFERVLLGAGDDAKQAAWNRALAAAN